MSWTPIALQAVAAGRPGTRLDQGWRLGFHPAGFANVCQTHYHRRMSTMNVSLPDGLKDFVDEQVKFRGFGTSSEYVRELIRKEQDRMHLRGLLLLGGNSVAATPADPDYFASLRDRIKNRSLR
jgi:antitoxin ParD1/3/4